MRKTILGTLVAVVATLVLVVGLYSAQRTTYLSLPFTNSADMNDALRRIDSVLGHTVQCTQVLASAVNPTEAGGTDDYLSLNDGGGSTTEANEDDFILAAVGADFLNLRCVVDVAPGSGDDWTLTLRDDGASTALTCVIDDANVNCEDVTNEITAAAGSKMNVEIDSAAGATDPDAAALMECSVCMKATY